MNKVKHYKYVSFTIIRTHKYPIYLAKFKPLFYFNDFNIINNMQVQKCFAFPLQI